MNNIDLVYGGDFKIPFSWVPEAVFQRIISFACNGYARVADCISWQVAPATVIGTRDLAAALELLPYWERLNQSDASSPAELIAETYGKNLIDVYLRCYSKINLFMFHQESESKPQGYYTVMAWSLLCLSNNDFKEIQNLKECLQNRVSSDNAIGSLLKPIFAEDIPIALGKLFENRFSTLNEDLALIAEKTLRTILGRRTFIGYFLEDMEDSAISELAGYNELIESQDLESSMFITLLRALLKIEDRVSGIEDCSRGVLSAFDDVVDVYCSDIYGKLRVSELKKLHLFILSLMDGESPEKIQRISLRLQKKWGIMAVN